MPLNSRTLVEVAPGTHAFVRAIGGSDQLDISLATGEILRASAILETFVDSLPDERANDRYVLWTVQSILRDAVELAQAAVAETPLALDEGSQAE